MGSPAWEEQIATPQKRGHRFVSPGDVDARPILVVRYTIYATLPTMATGGWATCELNSWGVTLWKRDYGQFPVLWL